uniref:Thyroglobulin type-1 domain-containing protein n=1 Tax=Globodera pallida TaxID=36090 RepID=A0A183C9R6_GLOPA
MFSFPTFCFVGAFIILPVASEASQRLCEVQGTCFRCEPGQFSRFICRSDSECFPGEFCESSRGFCCPSRRSPDDGASATTEKCPDGGGWERMCRGHGDCLFGDEMCAEGKCCPSCKQRRLQSLREAAVGGGAWVDRPPGLVIPQCSDDGKFHRPMQCAGGSSECYCVDKFGRNIGPKRGDVWRDMERGTDTEMFLNCSQLRKALEEGKEKGHKTTGIDEAILAAQSNRDGERGEDSKLHTDSEEESCADSLRVFHHCGSACPISCATLRAPQCPQEQCLRGCFCRLPYVVLDSADPFGSRCVLPAECPLLTFTPDLDSWNGGFFPAASADERSKRTQGKCADPLKNFQSCGSACPVGCGRVHADGRWEGCSAKCVSGCFCRVPFLLRDPSNPDSPCVLPQQCPPPSTSVPPPSAGPPSLLGGRLCPLSENKTLTSCFSRKCSLSCADLSPDASRPPCVPDDCLPGCQCQLPTVVKDKSTAVWECILPENCPEKNSPQQQPTSCGDPRKEFLTCGSSCPLGCDRLDRPQLTCSPCASGCFCRNGFIFANGSDWRRSECVSVSECPFAPATTKVTFQRQMDSADDESSSDSKQKREGQKECGEAMASATLLRKDGQRLGRVVARPEQRTDGRKSRRIRLSGEFAVGGQSWRGGVGRELELSIHRFSGTPSDECAAGGPPLALRVVEEEAADCLREGFDVVSSMHTELKALPAQDGARDRFGMDLVVAWPDPIARGTNPLVGHSVELKLRRSGEAGHFLLGCAILGITPSC